MATRADSTLSAAEVPILMYHSIAESGPGELAPFRIAPSIFEAQMRFLVQSGCYSLSLEDWTEAIRDRRRLPGHPVIITFDDGYRNFIEYAWPILEMTGLTATMFVVTDKVGQVADWDTVAGEPLPLMQWDELRRLRDRGLQIGSHSATHASLPSLTNEQIVLEGARSRERLKQELSLDVRSIAFPYGHTDARVRQCLAGVGYTIGVATWGGISSVADDPQNLPRIEIFPDDDLDAFARKVGLPRPSAPRSTPPDAPAAVQTVPVNLKGVSMRIDPHYAQALAVRLERLVAEFIALHSELVLAGANTSAQTLSARVAQIFREPLTGPQRRNLAPYETLASGVTIGFEREARVMLTISPKSDHGASPEHCVNMLEFDLTGPTRWFAFEVPCEWADFRSAQRFQLGLYAAVSRGVPGRAVVRVRDKAGEAVDLPLAEFEYSPEQRSVNRSGDFPKFDFIEFDPNQRPILLVDFDTRGVPDLRLRLNYLSVYFD